MQIDSIAVSVLYENGDREDLSTTEAVRDGLLSLGWVQPQPPTPADSGSYPSPDVASAAGVSHSLPSVHLVTVSYFVYISVVRI